MWEYFSSFSEKGNTLPSLQSIIPNLVSLSEEIDGLTKSLKINYHLFFKELTEKMFKKEELEKNKYDKKLIIDNPHNIYKNLDVNITIYKEIIRSQKLFFY